MIKRELIEGLLKGDRHRGGLQCIRLFWVEAQALGELRSELDALRRNSAPSRVSDPDHVTHWVGARGEVLQYSLWNGSGRTDDFSSDHDLSCGDKRFVGGGAYPSLAALIARLPHLINVRLNVLCPGASLPAHEEHVPFITRRATIGARVRLHLPIASNPAARVTLDGRSFHLEPGAAYLFNQGCVHAACNRGSTDREHLVWDMLLTREVFEWMFGGAPLGTGWSRTAASDRSIEFQTEPQPREYRRVPPSVASWQAERLDFCEPQ